MARSQNRRNTTDANFSRNQIMPGIKSRNGKGAYQPPRNMAVVNAAIANIYTYSASMKKAKRKPLYST
ncbi:hypothetical protein D3C81_1870740 [compost metagenome]